MTQRVRLLLSILPIAAIAGCSLPPQGSALVSAQFPPGTGNVNSASEPQPLNSLPVGAANYVGGPFAFQPNFASIQIGGR